jgi:hypothetical protein
MYLVVFAYRPMRLVSSEKSFQKFSPFLVSESSVYRRVRPVQWSPRKRRPGALRKILRDLVLLAVTVFISCLGERLSEVEIKLSL